MLKRLLMIGAVAASISVGGCVGVGAAWADTAVWEGPGRRRVRRRSVPSSSANGRMADLDAVQLGGGAGSDRYTGQRRLMTCKMHDVPSSPAGRGWGAHCAYGHAASEDDARRRHQDKYADEPLVAVHQ